MSEQAVEPVVDIYEILELHPHAPSHVVHRAIYARLEALSEDPSPEALNMRCILSDALFTNHNSIRRDDYDVALDNWAIAAKMERPSSAVWEMRSIVANHSLSRLRQSRDSEVFTWPFALPNPISVGIAIAENFTIATNAVFGRYVDMAAGYTRAYSEGLIGRSQEMSRVTSQMMDTLFLPGRNALPNRHIGYDARPR